MRFRFPPHRAGERRLIRYSAKEQGELEQQIDEFNRNEAADIQSARDAYVFDNESKKRTWEKVFHRHTGFLEMFRKTARSNGAVDEAARERIEKTNKEMYESSMGGIIGRLEKSMSKQDLTQELQRERVAVIREMLDSVHKNIQGLQQRIDRYKQVNGISLSMMGQIDARAKDFEEKKKYLEGALAAAQKKIAESQVGSDAKAKEFDDADREIRAGIIKVLNLNDPSSKEIMQKLDVALLEAAGKRTAKIDAIVATLKANPALDKLDVSFIEKKVADYCRNDAGAGIARERIRSRMRANEGGAEARMQALLALPLGQRVNIGGTEYVLAAKNADRDTIILRSAKNHGMTLAVKTKAENDAFACVGKGLKDTKAIVGTLRAPKVRDDKGKIIPKYDTPDAICFSASVPS